MVGSASPSFVGSIASRPERDAPLKTASVEATAGLQRAVVVAIGVVVRVWRCCFTNCSSAVHGCATAPVAFEHAASSELAGRDHNHVVPGDQVVEAVVPAVGSGRAAQHGPGRVAASVRGIQLHCHTVHPHFRPVDGAAVVGVEPDPVAQAEQRGCEPEVEGGIVGAAGGLCHNIVRRTRGFHPSPGQASG